mgnify:CR=1 FL=1
MDVTIVIPVLNEAHRIEKILQALVGYDVIVVDGGSEDSTIGIARQYDVTILSWTKGRASQMNAGAERAEGDQLLFLHADTILPQDWDVVLENMSNLNRVWGRFDVGFDDCSIIFNVIARMMNLRSRFTGICTGDQGMFVKRSLFNEIGGFANIPLMEDLELSKRLRKFSRPHCSASKVITSSRRWRQNGILRTILLMWWLRVLYFFGVSPWSLAKQYNPHQ